MAENITLTNLANLQNDTTAVNAINSNNAIITSAFTDVLSRAGNQPNSMGSPIDMNNWPILNLPAPGSANSPARLQDVVNPNTPINISLSLTGDATAPASSGNLVTTVGKVNGVSYPASPTTGNVPVVTGANTVAYQQITSANIANNTITASDIANNTITATQLANNTVGNAQLRQSSGFSVLGNTNSTTGNVADITGTTRQVLMVNAGGTALQFLQPKGDQLLGTNTNDVPTAGNVGEFISSFVAGSTVSLTNNTPVNVTSISLTPGDWDVWVVPIFAFAGSTTWTSWSAAATTSSGSFSTPITFNNNIFASVTPGATASVQLACSMAPLKLSTTTTLFLVVSTLFGTSTMTAGGSINARRRR